METEKLESEWLNDFLWSFRPPICNWLQSQRQIIDDLACRNSSNIGHWMLDLATDKTSTMQKSCKHGWVLQNLRKIFINLRTCTKPVFKTETWKLSPRRSTRPSGAPGPRSRRWRNTPPSSRAPRATERWHRPRPRPARLRKEII